MNDTIRVGDRAIAHGKTGIVVGLCHRWAWIDDGGGRPLTYEVNNLTRIEPEPVTLRPKYAVGQEVLCDGLGISTINGVFVGYTVKEHGGIWLNGDLEAVPEPCEK